MPFQTQSGIAQIKLPGGVSVQVKAGPTTKAPKRPPLGSTDVCSQAEQRAISSAFAYSAMLIPEIRLAGGNWVDLADKMDKLGFNDLWITCDLCKSGEPASSAAASSSGGLGSMAICAFPAQLSELTRIIMREQVRLAGGLAIDMWIVDGYLWCKASTTSWGPLDPRARPAMCTGLPYSFLGTVTKVKQGMYTWWDPVSGEVRTQQSPPNPGHQGPTVVPGGQHAWQYTC
jgi:hypothetical protein